VERTALPIDGPIVDPRLGTVLRGKYRLDAVLGAGGMATVYAATHRNQKRFAIKLLHPQISVDPDLRRRFLREGYIANGVGHNGVVGVLDDDVSDDGAAFLVMELLEGETLKDLWDRVRPIDCQTVLAIAHDLLDVLSAAHDKGIVHRDIKPANVFLTDQGELKVLDFGIARLRDGQLHTTTHASLLGTPAFMAPEQASGDLDAIGPPSDVWAVGATIFLLLSGEVVHPAKNTAQLLIMAASLPARSLRSVAPNLPPSVIALVDRALAFRPFQRFQDAREMRDAIDALHREIYGGPITSETRGHWVTMLRTRPKPNVGEQLGLAKTVQDVSEVRTLQDATRTAPTPRRFAYAALAAASAFAIAASMVVLTKTSKPRTEAAPSPTASAAASPMTPIDEAPVASAPPLSTASGRPATKAPPRATVPRRAPATPSSSATPFDPGSVR
jgi:eukaryotic-like serine/threonine-protein kinase